MDITTSKLVLRTTGMARQITVDMTIIVLSASTAAVGKRFDIDVLAPNDTLYIYDNDVISEIPSR